MRSTHRRLLSLALVAFATGAPSAARADDKAAAAEALFNEGQRLFNDGAINAACDKLQESYNLEPAMGALFALAACHEKQGKTASAWSEFKTLEAQAQQKGRKDREDYAHEAIGRLEPKLRKVAVRVKVPVDGMEVKRNGVAVGKAQWGLPIPVDPGTVKIEAVAPGKKAFNGTIEAPPGPGTTEFEVPALADAPVDVGPGPGPGPGKDTGGGGGFFSPGRIAGIAIGVAGLGAATTGVVFNLFAFKANDKAKDNTTAADNAKEPTTCKDTQTTPYRCAAQTNTSSKSTDQTAAYLLYGAGGALVIGGVVLLVLSGPAEKKGDARPLIVPVIGGDQTGLMAVGRF